MGFRNPVTTAAAVDTGRGGDAGVRLFQDLSVPAVPAGIAEWRTGKMSRNARVTLSGGGPGGSSFLIDGGNAGVGPDAPTLGLNVESAPAGGYRGVLRLGGAKVIDYAGAVALGPYTALPFTFPAGWSNWGSGLEPVRVRQTPDALVHVNGVCVANVGPYAHGWVIMTGLPAPGTLVPVPIFLGGGSEWAGGIVFPDGSLQFDQFAGAAPAAGTGVHLNFAYWPSGL